MVRNHYKYFNIYFNVFDARRNTVALLMPLSQQIGAICYSSKHSTTIGMQLLTCRKDVPVQLLLFCFYI